MELNSCLNLATTEEMLNALLVKDSVSGEEGLNTMEIDADCDDVTQVLQCGQPLLSLQDILRKVIGVDACGRPAIKLIKATP